MPKDKPDPRPILVTNMRSPAALEFTIVVPNWCLDNQSQALTHDQLKHMTGRILNEAMVERRKELEKNG